MRRLQIVNDQELTKKQEKKLFNKILGKKLSEKLEKEIKERIRKSDSHRIRKDLVEHIILKYVKKKYPQPKYLPNVIDSIPKLSCSFRDMWEVYTDIIAYSTPIKKYFLD